MRGNEPVEAPVYLFVHRFLGRAISARVALSFFAEAEPDHHPQAIRLERKYRLNAREEQYLVRARISDPGKFLESTSRPCGWVPHRTWEVAEWPINRKDFRPSSIY